MRAQITTKYLCHTTTSIRVYIQQREVTEATLTNTQTDVPRLKSLSAFIESRLIPMPTSRTVFICVRGAGCLLVSAEQTTHGLLEIRKNRTQNRCCTLYQLSCVGSVAVTCFKLCSDLRTYVVAGLPVDFIPDVAAGRWCVLCLTKGPALTPESIRSSRRGTLPRLQQPSAATMDKLLAAMSVAVSEDVFPKSLR